MDKLFAILMALMLLCFGFIAEAAAQTRAFSEARILQQETAEKGWEQGIPTNRVSSTPGYVKTAFIIDMQIQAAQKQGFVLQSQEELLRLENKVWERNPDLNAARQGEVILLANLEAVSQNPGIFLPAMEFDAVGSASDSSAQVEEPAPQSLEAHNHDAIEAIGTTQARMAAEFEQFRKTAGVDNVARNGLQVMKTEREKFLEELRASDAAALAKVELLRQDVVKEKEKMDALVDPENKDSPLTQVIDRVTNLESDKSNTTTRLKSAETGVFQSQMIMAAVVSALFILAVLSYRHIADLKRKTKVLETEFWFPVGFLHRLGNLNLESNPFWITEVGVGKQTPYLKFTASRRAGYFHVEGIDKVTGKDYLSVNNVISTIKRKWAEGRLRGYTMTTEEAEQYSKECHSMRAVKVGS